MAEEKLAAGVIGIPPVLVFVGGLHRSGTSLVHRWLTSHPDVTGFSGTSVPEDEGQHLQSVYLPDHRLGGAGRFAFEPAAHMTERSGLVSAESRARLTAEWAPHWSPGAAVGVEKSPPNLIRARFLQALFPNAVFVMVLRHPIAVAGATRKGRRRLLNYETLLHHWVVAHAILAQDAPRIRNLHVVRYERFVADPNAALAPVLAAVGLPPTPVDAPLRTNINTLYLDQWRRPDPLRRRDRRRTTTRWEHAVNQFGYSLIDPTRCDDTDLPPAPSPTGRERSPTDAPSEPRHAARAPVTPAPTDPPRAPVAYALACIPHELAKALRLHRRSSTPTRRGPA